MDSEANRGCLCRKCEYKYVCDKSVYKNNSANDGAAEEKRRSHVPELLLVFFILLGIYLYLFVYPVINVDVFDVVVVVMSLIIIGIPLSFLWLVAMERRKELRKADEIRNEVRGKIYTLADNSIQVTPEEIIRLRQATINRNNYGSQIANDYVGVYVIYNETKDMYYVGQAKKVLQRVTQHFTGHGNGDVYADYKYGDQFSIKTIAFNTSGYDSLDRLEKDTIEAYAAFSKGYNKNRGNSY